MKYLLSFLTALTMLATSCQSQEQSNQQQSLMEASRQELAEALAERDMLLGLVEEMTASMDQIKRLEDIVAITGSQSSENKAQCRRLLADMDAVRESLRMRRERLAEMDERMKKSSFYTDELKSTIAAMRKMTDAQTEEVERLKARISQSDKIIDSLNVEIDSLNSTVAIVNSSLDSMQSASIRLENELNECYYVIASKSQLKEHKIIETGFLRNLKLMKGDFDRDFFVTADKRSLKKLYLNADKAKILTNHPEGSYALVEDVDGLVLMIIDSCRFWNLSNFLVIQVG